LLVISRRPGQTFRIGDEIEVKVLEVDGATVRIGITAPVAVGVFRGELLNPHRGRRRREVNGADGQPPTNNVA
jgi:carbon storage regulator CsrA